MSDQERQEVTRDDRDAEFNAALIAGDSHLLAKLVSEGLDVNEQDSAGETPLTNSVSERFGDLGSSSRIRTLVQLGARVAKESAEGCFGTSVHSASGLGYLHALIELLAADGRVALQTFDDLGRTPLECAVESGNVDVVRALFDARAQPDFRDGASSADTAHGCGSDIPRSDLPWWDRCSDAATRCAVHGDRRLPRPRRKVGPRSQLLRRLRVGCRFRTAVSFRQ